MLPSQPPITPDQIEALPVEFRLLFKAVINHYERRIAELEAEVALIRKTLRNSSSPPSSEHPHAKPPRDKTKSKKRRGAQAGHRKHERTLIPTERCREVVPLYPDHYRRCGTALGGENPGPLRHQVWELPPIEPIVTEFHRYRRICGCCGEKTCVPLPDGVPTGQSGPRLVAFVGLLMGHFRQSNRRAAFFLQDFHGMPCYPSLTVKMQGQVADALEQPCEELRGALADEPQLFMDESPTKQGDRKAWLWTAVAPLFAVFAIFSSRKGEALPRLLVDAFPAVINCDRARMYWQAERLRWCWAHLKRDFQALIDHHDPQVRRLGHDLMRQIRWMFDTWWRFKLSKISWDEFRRETYPIRQKVDNLLLRGVFSGNRRLIGMCRKLFTHRQWLWTFVDVQGVEPTNNTAERALRPAVIFRKLSFGTQSASGSRFIERMLTVSETCRLQNRSIFGYLTAAIAAHFQARTVPPLRPAE